MAFAAVHIPDFILQAILRARPELREPQRALAVVDGKPLQQTVIVANCVALQSGIYPGMAKSQAEEFPAVLVVQRSFAQEATAHAALLDLGWAFSPRVEDTAPDTILLDLDGLASLFGSEENIAHRLARGACDLGLTAQIAVASNIQTAFHASRGYAGITRIPPGEESTRMSRLPVRILSPRKKFWKFWRIGACGPAGIWRRCRSCNSRSGWDSKEFDCGNGRVARGLVRWC